MYVAMAQIFLFKRAGKFPREKIMGTANLAIIIIISIAYSTFFVTRTRIEGQA